MTHKPEPTGEQPRILTLTPEQVATLGDALTSYLDTVNSWCRTSLDRLDEALPAEVRRVEQARYGIFRELHVKIVELKRQLLVAHSAAVAAERARSTHLPTASTSPDPASSTAPGGVSSSSATPCAAAEANPVGEGEAAGSATPCAPSPAAVTDCEVCGHAFHGLSAGCWALDDHTDSGVCECDGVWHYRCTCGADFVALGEMIAHSARCIVMAKVEDDLEAKGHLTSAARQTPRAGEGWRRGGDALAADLPPLIATRLWHALQLHVAREDLRDERDLADRRRDHLVVLERAYARAERRTSRQLRALALVFERDGATPEAWVRLAPAYGRLTGGDLFGELDISGRL